MRWGVGGGRGAGIRRLVSRGACGSGLQADLVSHLIWCHTSYAVWGTSLPGLLVLSM